MFILKPDVVFLSQIVIMENKQSLTQRFSDKHQRRNKRFNRKTSCFKKRDVLMEDCLSVSHPSVFSANASLL